jgi:hypothetical protein
VYDAWQKRQYAERADAIAVAQPGTILMGYPPLLLLRELS